MSLPKEILEMYEDREIGKNEICEECDNYCDDRGYKKVGPFSLFHGGKKFQNDKYKVLFVGKNTWFDCDEYEYFLENNKIIGEVVDVTDIGAAYLKTDCTPFWKLILKIVEDLYEECYLKATERIAITNMMKCNISNGSRDETPDCMKECCILRNKIIKEEIKILKPNYVIFFTGPDYVFYIEGLFKFDNKQNNNKKKSWLLRIGKIDINGDKINFIITYHPGFKELRKKKNKREFIKFVINWIKQPPE